MSRSRLSDKDIRKLERFVRRTMPAPYHPTTMTVYEHGLKAVTGETRGAVVDVNIPARPGRYPRSCTYRKGAGPLRFACVHEEVVAVMAHEWRHVAQHRTRKRYAARYSEVDAESVARFVLDVYRQRKRCCQHPHK